MEEPTTDPQLVIRTYEPRDYDAVWALHREGVMATTPEALDVYAKYEDDLGDIENEYLGAGSNFWVAESVGALVGMAAIQRIDAETGRLRRMRVTAAWRRRGVARLLLDTTEQQTAAHRLYEAAGFTRTGERSLGPFRVFFYETALK